MEVKQIAFFVFNSYGYAIYIIIACRCVTQNMLWWLVVNSFKMSNLAKTVEGFPLSKFCLLSIRSQ